MRISTVACSVLVAAAAASASSAAEPHDEGSPALAPPPRAVRGGLRRTVWVPSSSPIRLAEAVPHHRRVYMNREGGRYTGSTTGDDPATNASVVVAMTGNGQGGTLSPFDFGDAAWERLVSCVRERYGPFDIEFTDVEPSAGPYVEIAVAGTPFELGDSEDYYGVAPYACEPADSGISFAFAGSHDSADLEDLCWTVNQEIAHVFSLDHELLCADPMTYDASCGSHKVFTDMAASCGEDMPRPCDCGGDTQNSVALLRAALGDSRDAAPPQLTITAPADGATVNAGFAVEVTASDDVGVLKVELAIDGTVNATDMAAPWSFTTPSELGGADHALAVTAYDARGNATPQTIQVTVTPGEPPYDSVDGFEVRGGCAAAGGRRAAAAFGGRDAEGRPALALLLLALALASLSGRARASSGAPPRRAPERSRSRSA